MDSNKTNYLEDVERRARDFIESRASDVEGYRERLDERPIETPTVGKVLTLRDIFEKRKEEYLKYQAKLDGLVRARKESTGGTEWLRLTNEKKRLEEQGKGITKLYVDAKYEFESAKALLSHGPLDAFVRAMTPYMLQNAETEIQQAYDTIEQVRRVQEKTGEESTEVLDTVDLTVDTSDSDDDE